MWPLEGESAWGSRLAYFLVIVFGSSTWLGVNSVWVELPLLVSTLPEGWGLPSFLAVIIQIATVGPILYSIWERFHGWVVGHRRWLICAFIALGAACLLLLAVVWDHTGVVGGVRHSVALFVLFFFLSIVCSVSNVLFLPFMASFRPEHMTAFFMGMGISAFIPSVLSLAQGASRTECVPANASNANDSGLVQQQLAPSFSESAFFCVVAGWMTLTLLAFLVLAWGRQAAASRKPPPPELPPAEPEEPTEATPVVLMKPRISYGDDDDSVTIQGPVNKSGGLSLYRYGMILSLVVWVNVLMNGFLPAVQSYSCLPYGPLTYHLAVVFSNLANPIACFVPHFVQIRGCVLTTYGLLTATATGLAAYIVVLAAASPVPPLQDSLGGPILCVAAWTLSFGILAYLRTVMASQLREASGNSERRLFWYGAMTQTGAFIGSVVAFVLVNVAGLFHSDPNPCE